MRTSLKTVFPELLIFGCLFHYCQALNRRMRSMPELFLLIRMNDTARNIFRKIQCLALLPADDIMDGFVLLLREALSKEEL